MEEDGDGMPLAVGQKGRHRSVKIASVDDLWRIDEEWWREKPITRIYYQLTAEGGGRLTVFQDLTDGNWYRQGG